MFLSLLSYARKEHSYFMGDKSYFSFIFSNVFILLHACHLFFLYILFEQQLYFIPLIIGRGVQKKEHGIKSALKGQIYFSAELWEIQF